MHGQTKDVSSGILEEADNQGGLYSQLTTVDVLDLPSSRSLPAHRTIIASDHTAGYLTSRVCSRSTTLCNFNQVRQMANQARASAGAHAQLLQSRNELSRPRFECVVRILPIVDRVLDHSVRSASSVHPLPEQSSCGGISGIGLTRCRAREISDTMVECN
jgi:hypothetical protein